MRLTFGIAVAFTIGMLCGMFKIPLPAPNHWMGILLIVLIYIGFLAGRWISS